MRIRNTTLPHLRLASLVFFFAVCAFLFGYLWLNSGGRLPLISQESYRVSLDLPRVSNLVFDSDVMISGVPVGKIVELEPEGRNARAVIELEQNFPLHEGVSIEVRNKTLISETYLDITDGKGPEIADGTQLPMSAGKPAVELDDVLRQFDPPTRGALGQFVRSAGAGTQGKSKDISAAVRGLGEVGRQGGTVTDALAKQSESLRRLTGNTAQLLSSLDTRRGQIVELTQNSKDVFAATAKNEENLKQTIRILPKLLGTTNDASDDISTLSRALQPVAANLNEAAPDLTAALKELPATSRDLRGLVPPLDRTLDRAPATLVRVPPVAKDLSSFFKTTNVALTDLNPILGYLKPYRKDIPAFFTNFGEGLNGGDANGKAAKLYSVFNVNSVTGLPLEVPGMFQPDSNAYPKPGMAANPGPFTGQYPRVQPDPIQGSHG